ncbi:MAG: tetratricopeptide repeat protein, partial [Candidatus Eisenbacteria bacterium]
MHESKGSPDFQRLTFTFEPLRVRLLDVKILVPPVALLLALALAAAARGETPDSASQYRSEDALHRYAAGRLLEDAGQSAEALREYYRALALDPKAVAVARRVSELCARVGDASRSLEFADRGLALAPSDARLLWLKGAALFNLGRAAESLPPLEAAVAADSGDADFTRTLARVAEQLGRPELVAQAWRKTTAADEEDGEAWFQLAGAEARLGRFDSADKALASAKDLSPVRPGILFMEGWIREGQGRRPEAIELFRRHLKIHPDDKVTRRRLVKLLAREKRWDEAYREAEQVSRGQPEDFVALEVEADLAFRAKRTADGERLVRLLREQSGRDEERMLRVLGLLARNGRAKQGVTLAEAWGKEARPPHGDDLAAEALALAGDSKGA